jgi:mono/diheme cytochrome c family protein
VKTLTVASEKWAPKLLFVQTTILPPAAAPPMTDADRAANQKLAIADRQAVFKGDCARCHVEPAKNLYGVQLYEKACGICHEAEHRATMVADLHKLPHETNAEFWRNWITHGKSDSLMPAFAVEEGGILNREQIESLVSYLIVAIPSKPGLPPAPKPTASLK